MNIKLKSVLLFGLFLQAPSTYSQSNAEFSPASVLALEKKVVSEINFARQKPREYAKLLENRRQFYSGRFFEAPGVIPIKTKEGVGALDEAIRFLRKAKPVAPLTLSIGMSLAASDHVRDQGPDGKLGHSGSDGSQPWDRIGRHGEWQSTVGENIAYGEKTARDIVIGLLVDDGVPSRGHRKNTFNPEYRVLGVAFGYHKKFRTMCVIDFAGGFVEK